MTATTVLDTGSWLLAVPLLPAAGALDFSTAKLTAAFTSAFGGAPIVTASSASPGNPIVFVPAANGIAAHFLIDLPNDRRTSFTVARPLAVFADVKWYPDPSRPTFNQPVGRVELRVLPATDSPGIAAASSAPVLVPACFYEERAVLTPLLVGPQGAAAYPAFDPVMDEGKALRIVGGVPVWA